jgi:hypothetical protein
VHTHVSNALRKTNCANRTELAVLAVRDGVRSDGDAVPGRGTDTRAESRQDYR